MPLLFKNAPSADERRDAMLRVFAEKLLAKMPASILIIGQRPAFSKFDVARAAVSVNWISYG